jgi:aminomethyltransferase
MSLNTALHEEHVALGARMIDFGGWMMPVQYEGIVAEHQHTRTAVSMFDTCHMGQILIEGPDAEAALAHLLTTKLAGLADGQCRYGFMLNEQGGVIDDLITYQLEAQRFLVVVNAGTREHDLAWIRDHLVGRPTVTDLTFERGKIDVQGPEARQPVEAVLGTDMSDLKYFRSLETTWCDHPVTISRTGYTGEYGFEIYADCSQMPHLWQAFLGAGVKPAGLGARDTLRLEAGLPLYGHELAETITPAQAGLMRFTADDRPFIGKEALLASRDDGSRHALVGFRIEGRQSARHGHGVLAGETPIGQVASGSFAPTLGISIGTALVERDFATPGTAIAIDNGRKALDAEVVELPFYKRRP